MTALTPPAADAPAAEWGALAVSIPGWRWPDGKFAIEGWTESWTVEADHWAWEGWLLRLLGDEWGAYQVALEEVDWRQPPNLTLGRACIAAAAALGRWPGGEE